MKRRYAGGFVDEGLSPQAMKLVAELPSSASAVGIEIGELLGAYRQWREFRDSPPPAAEIRDHLTTTAEAAQLLAAGIAELPRETLNFAGQLAADICGEDCGMTDQATLARKLETIGGALKAVARNTPHGRPGPRRKALEQKLLSDVSKVLETAGLKPPRAAVDACEILTAAGVHGLATTKPRAAVIRWRAKNPC